MNPTPIAQQAEAWERVRGLLTSQRFVVLSTQSNSGPYSSLVAFWAADSLDRVLFATMRDARKYGFLAEHPQVALLFDDRSNQDIDLSRAAAVTAIGNAHEITEVGARSEALATFLDRHPDLDSFANTPGCALIGVDIEVFHLVTHFQDTVELRPTP